ncbi:MAG TPA: GNAT family N-acetyltransferase [Anaerolineales bacterium]|nr:GNAT family N-acetyltransferase [Anaerolineales bacterium]
MDTFYSRPANSKDFDVVAALMEAHFQADYQGESSFSAADLHSLWESIALEMETWGVFEGDRGIAWAWFPSRTREEVQVVDLQVFILPSERGMGLETRMLKAVEDRFQPAKVGRTIIQPMVTNEPMAQALKQAGYTFELAFQKMVISAAQMPEVETPPPGLLICPFRIGVDEQKAYEADEEASQDKGYSSPVPFEKWVSRMLNNPEFCFLAWDGEQIAGGVYTQIFEGQGLIHHLGVRRPWRNRGLGARLMQQTFAACYLAGVRKIWLEVDTQSLTGANRLYEKLGMQIVGVRSYYQKELN